MIKHPQKPLLQQADAVIKRAITALHQQFPTRGMSLYKLGSLAHGGFSKVSDVDLAVILNDPATEADAEKIAVINQQVKALKMPYADRISIFWSTPQNFTNSNYGRFPSLDKLDLLQFGKLIAGEEVRHILSAPLQRDLEIEGAEFIISMLLTPAKMAELKTSQEIVAKGARYLTKAVLFPVRLIFTLDHPQIIATNEEAVNSYLKLYPENTAIAALLQKTIMWRERDENEVINEALPLLKENISTLYLQLLIAYQKSMKQHRQTELANKLFALEEKINKK